MHSSSDKKKWSCKYQYRDVCTLQSKVINLSFWFLLRRAASLSTFYSSCRELFLMFSCNYDSLFWLVNACSSILLCQSAVSGLNRGLAANEDDLQKADEAAKEIEAVGGPVDLSADLDKLQGRWKLIYSSAFSSRTLGGSRPGPPTGRLLPITLGQVQYFWALSLVSHWTRHKLLFVHFANKTTNENVWEQCSFFFILTFKFSSLGVSANWHHQ